MTIGCWEAGMISARGVTDSLSLTLLMEMNTTRARSLLMMWASQVKFKAKLVPKVRVEGSEVSALSEESIGHRKLQLFEK